MRLRIALAAAVIALMSAAAAQPAQSPATLAGLAAQQKALAFTLTQLQVQVRALQTQVGGIQSRLTTGLPGQPSLTDLAREVSNLNYQMQRICQRGQLVSGFSGVTNSVEYVHC